MKRKLIDTPTSRRKGRHGSSSGKKKAVDNNFSMTQEEFHDNVRWVEEPSPREVHDSVPLPAVTNVTAIGPTMKPPLRKRFDVASD
jgi:hypothetical protein